MVQSPSDWNQLGYRTLCQFTVSEQWVEPGKACGISGFDYRVFKSLFNETHTHTQNKKWTYKLKYMETISPQRHWHDWNKSSHSGQVLWERTICRALNTKLNKKRQAFITMEQRICKKRVEKKKKKTLISTLTPLKSTKFLSIYLTFKYWFMLNLLLT